jgi:hypothetical protein
MTRNVRLLALAGLALVAVLVVVVNVVQGQQLSPQEKSLKATAGKFAAALREPDERYSAIPDQLQAFNRFQHDQQLVLQTRTKDLAGPGEFAQILVWETKTMPPTSLLLRSTREPVVTVSGDPISKADGGDDTFATVQGGSVQYRVYLTALTPPPTIKAMNGHEILEVFHPA